MSKDPFKPKDLLVARSLKRLSQKEVASKIGVSQPEYGRIELGRRDPGKHAPAISQVLGITVLPYYDPVPSSKQEPEIFDSATTLESDALLVELRLLKKLFDAGSISKDVFDKERLVLLEKHGF